MMVAEVKFGSRFEAGTPHSLFDAGTGVIAWYDVSKDGRFLIPTPVEQTSRVQMTVVVNWTAGLPT
jgi:hypothetical protein